MSFERQISHGESAPRTHFPTPFSVTTVLPVLGPMTPIGRTTVGALPLTVAVKLIGMLALIPGGLAKGAPVTA
jgi:hypothetical protein